MTQNAPSKHTLDAVRLAWVLCVLAVVLGWLALGLFFITRTTVVPETWGSDAGPRTGSVTLINQIFTAVIFGLLGPLLGALVVTRHSRHPIGWLLCLVGLSFGMLQTWVELTVYTNFTRPSLLGGLWVAWVMNWLWAIPINMMILIVALFPNGRLPAGHRRWPIGLILLSLGLMAGGSFIEQPMHSAFGLDNPLIQPQSNTLFNLVFALGVIAFSLAACATAWQNIVRFRQARGDERQQFKWLATTMILAVNFIIGGLILAFIFDITLGQIMVSISIGFPVLGIGLTILRYRLYEIDIIIRRSLIYTLVTAMLALIYFGLVIVLQSLFGSAIGQTSQLIIVISTLTIAARFNPLRRRIQSIMIVVSIAAATMPSRCWVVLPALPAMKWTWNSSP